MYIHAVIESANHVTAVQCKKHADTCQHLQVMFTSDIRVKKKFDLCDFDRERDTGTWNWISKSVDLVFTHTTDSRIYT